MSIKELAFGLILIAALTVSPAVSADAAVSPGKTCKGSVSIIKGKVHCIAPRPPVKPAR